MIIVLLIDAQKSTETVLDLTWTDFGESVNYISIFLEKELAFLRSMNSNISHRVNSDQQWVDASTHQLVQLQTQLRQGTWNK